MPTHCSNSTLFPCSKIIQLKEHDSYLPNPRLQEIYYYVGTGDLMRNDDLTTESTCATIRDAGNQELAEALTCADGVLQGGLQPAARVANEEGQKELLKALGESQVGKSKNPKNPKEKTEKAEPKTLDEPLGQRVIQKASIQTLQEYLSCYFGF